jgi:predicted MFS family arabinose efflux permease
MSPELDYRVRSASINLSRAIYGMNWFNIAPGLSYIASNFQLHIVSLGIMTTSFYIGLSLFQMLGGILASKIGNVRTSILGITILGISVIATARSMDLTELIISRFFAGFGSSLFFSPALGLLHQIVPEGNYSFHVGLFNGAFNIGAGAGIIGWSYLDLILGWRTPLLMAGFLMLAMALENLMVLRGIKSVPSSWSNVRRDAGKLLRRKNLWLLPIFAISAILSETVVGQLLVYFLEVKIGFSPQVSSLLDMVFLFIGFAGGIIGGFIFSRNPHTMEQFALVVALCAVIVMIMGFSHTFIAFLAEVSILGIVTVNSLSILYTLASRNIRDPGMISFSLSFVNFIQNIVGAFSPTIFGIFAKLYGFGISWVIIGIMGAAGMLAFIFMDRTQILAIRADETTISTAD